MSSPQPEIRWNFEFGEREKHWRDPDYDLGDPFVKRVPDGNARFACGEHYSTGWQKAEEARRFAADHLSQEHGVTAPWL